ncbi:hypothetical protein L916_01807 [Plasmopara halstedii]|uniref:RING-type domain-containing protein n=1 Tax=Plasmopara halstedii TaxID=4781 RepID=A0A0P1A596_PLAHL|nr:hypothetical protein L916_01807 [Plasmopara halstedii]CEG35718.1 hypothetical protein L916_01807 [Plasmopara halstedii]|eukprot:XP_024572087.1 hypothetical protein L916_01807 [Plasmopara halstedii]
MLLQSSGSRSRRHRRATVAGLSGTPAKSPVASPTSLCPPTVAYLEQLEIVVKASKIVLDYGKDVDYNLVITPASDSSRQWTISQSFQELQIFQRDLLELLQLGHLCHGECPYLYSSIKDRFPKECYLYSTSSYVVRKRQQALQEFFDTLLVALRKRDNPCSILPGAVAEKFIGFLNKRLPFKHEYHFENFLAKDKEPRSFSMSSSTDSSYGTPTDLWQRSSDKSIESTTNSSSSKNMLIICGLCDSDDDVNMTFTTLSCGHRFHDECVVVKLNETLACPTCGQKL